MTKLQFTYIINTRPVFRLRVHGICIIFTYFISQCNIVLVVCESNISKYFYCLLFGIFVKTLKVELILIYLPSFELRRNIHMFEYSIWTHCVSTMIRISVISYCIWYLCARVQLISTTCNHLSVYLSLFCFVDDC